MAQRIELRGLGPRWRDVDQDGDIDLIGLDDRKFPEVIYANDGHGSFTALANAVTGVTGSAQYALWGLATLTDLDNDGIADVLIDGRVFFHVLRGTGGGHFSYQNDSWGKITHTAEASVDSGFAFGDIDADGDLDLIGYTAADPNRQVALYRNELPQRHWPNIRPLGLAGNRQRGQLQDPSLRTRDRAPALVRRSAGLLEAGPAKLLRLRRARAALWPRRSK